MKHIKRSCSCGTDGNSATASGSFYEIAVIKDQDTCNDDQVSHDFSFRDFFLQNEMREKQDKHIGGSINDRTIAHIYFCITPCIEEEDQHIYGV